MHSCSHTCIYVCAGRAVSEYYHLRDKVLSLDNELKKVSVRTLLHAFMHFCMFTCLHANLLACLDAFLHTEITYAYLHRWMRVTWRFCACNANRRTIPTRRPRRGSSTRTSTQRTQGALFLCLGACACACACISVYMYICVYVYVYLYICMYVYVYMYICVYVYVYLYICIYVRVLGMLVHAYVR